jgi:hypothetical protein
MGFGHVGHHHQPVLPSVLQSFAVRNSDAEASLGLIPVSNAPSAKLRPTNRLTGSKRCLITGLPLGILGRPPIVANDNHLTSRDA